MTTIPMTKSIRITSHRTTDLKQLLDLKDNDTNKSCFNDNKNRLEQSSLENKKNNLKENKKKLNIKLNSDNFKRNLKQKKK